ncbi:heterochromatin protein (macronuclear) [Tetrahymena thermophila SB210]|uniref:Heterochromatin protein n=1 Tax=Tetrahymena thermophila (strain SB210) TaxID=312017 RepID=Q22UM1_TETTS|nr:heterochromatin protein [Tetrahymena thermophila SB210]EAR88949.3 heterochromatin protein [Tetrahymena thermophila SB210]|eukprot:XP_001009194.3 heterochromatin protein [Tetrahymena thermophila SB210]
MKKRRQSTNNEKQEDLYEPEKILDKKVNQSGTSYLVKWKGFRASQATWEFYKNISHCNWLFEDWEEQQNRKELQKIKNMDRIIDKKYVNSKVFYLVSLKNGGEDVWIRRKALMLDHADKISEYEKSDQLVGAKRKYQQKRFSKSQDRFLSSDEDLSDSQSDKNSDNSQNNSSNSDNSQSRSGSSSDSCSRSSSEDNQDENTNQRGKSNGRRKGRIYNNKKKPKRGGNRKNQKGQNINDSNSSSDENSEQEVSESRRIVKTKRKIPKKCKILYDKLPFYGILGIDEPKSIKNMVIDKRVGTKDDGYFACDIIWKIRPNKQQPVDSRVSRKDIKEFYPLILIEFYEYNMTYNGEVVNADDEDDLEYYNGDDEEDADHDDEYYQKLQRKAGKKPLENENSEADNQDEKSEDSFSFQNQIYYGYAKTNEQKKYVKFDEKFFNNNQMEEM